MNHAVWVALALQQLSLVPALDDAPSRVDREAWVMGTRARIVVEADSEDTARAMAELALLEIERTDALLSTWDPESPLSRLNQASPGTWADVEPELAEWLRQAEAWSARTGGAFEARIGALVDAWDLRGSGRIPDDAELASALRSSGGRSVELVDGRLRRASPAAWIDAGGFGKGAALGAAQIRLDEEGRSDHRRVLIDLGGQLLALAPPSEPWTIDVAHPLHRSVPVASLSVHQGSVATSGTSERGRHILDPRTGRPVEAWGSVTVLASDPLAADALSTALYTMGPVDGRAWAEDSGVAALFLDIRDDRLRASWTIALEPLLATKPVAPNTHPMTPRNEP